MMDSTLKPAFLLMSGRALALTATFLIPVVLVRMFDQAEFGTYKQLFLIVSTLYGIAQLGMAESLFYFLPPASHERGRFVLNSLLVLAAAGLACLGLLALAGPKISQWMSNRGLSGYIPWIGIYLSLMMASAVLEIVMISLKRYLWAAASYAFSDLLRAIFLIVPVLLLGRLEWLLLGAVAFASVRLCAALFYIRREFGGELRPDARVLRTQLAYAVPLQASVLLAILEGNFHQYAVSYYFDAATFAIYAVGCLQIPLVDLVFSSEGNVMMVRMSEAIRNGRSKAVLEIWHGTTRRLALVFFALVGLLLVAASELIVLLFTESYRASVPIFMIFSTIILFATLQTDGVLRVYAQTRVLIVIYAIRLLVIAGLTAWLISSLELLGAVLATVAGTSVGKALGLARVKQLLAIPLSALLPWRALLGILVAAAAAGLLSVIVKSALEISTLPLLLTTSLVYIALYLTLLFKFNLLRQDERPAFTGWFQRFTAGATKAGECIRS